MISKEIFTFNLLKGVIFQHGKHHKKDLIKNLSNQLGMLNDTRFKIENDSNVITELTQKGTQSKSIIKNLIDNDLLETNSYIVQKSLQNKHFKSSVKLITKHNSKEQDDVLIVLCNQLDYKKSNRSIIKIVDIIKIFCNSYLGSEIKYAIDKMEDISDYLKRQNNILNVDAIKKLNTVIDFCKDREGKIQTYKTIQTQFSEKELKSEKTQTVKI